MTKQGNRSAKHDKEMRGYFDAREQEFTMERGKLEREERTQEARERAREEREEQRKKGK